MHNKIDILHIYAGTAGAAGLYLHEIYKTLEGKFTQEVIANYYYPFQEAKKYFYKTTELCSCKIKYKYLRFIIRYIELIIGLSKSYIYIKSKKPKVINYSLTSDLFVEYIFLFIVKYLTDSKIIITCHDVIPFQIRKKTVEAGIRRKKDFFLIADYLLIHNDNSRVELSLVYGINENIFIHPFPIMDLTQLFFDKKFKKNDAFTIGMFGHFRKEKGLDILIESWKLLSDKYTDIKLIIAGNFPDDNDRLLTSINKESNVLIIKSFIDDKMLFDLIQKCDIIVLPYRRSSNSGFPSMILSLSKFALTSDIPMFKDSPLINDFFLFDNGEPISLMMKIDLLKNMSISDREKLRDGNRNLLSKYKAMFDKEVISVYQTICNL
jgi:glycosyltransferase involved in cell wall biosynthesis